MILLPITMTIAAAATLFNIWLGRRVGQVRIANRISIGDGGNEALTARMRAQANFVEYTPFFLILLALIELAVGPRTWLWAVATVYILARILHAFGMDRPRPDRLHLRMIGILVTLLVLLGLSLYALYLAYLHPAGPHSALTYAGLS